MTDLIKRAEFFALALHLGQLHKGDAHEPYITHVDEVA